MMALKSLLLLILLAVIFLLLLCTVQAVSTLYVTPSANTTCRGEPCLTLNQYAKNTCQYFTDDTELVFLPGRHSLDGFQVKLKNVSRFVMRTESRDTLSNMSSDFVIVCSASAFAFKDVNNVTLSNLIFLSCGKMNPSLTIINVEAFMLAYSKVIRSSSDYAAVMTFNSYAILLGSTFEDNVGIYGGAVWSSNSTIELRDCVMVNNSAFVGGAVLANESMLTFHGSNMFAENKAKLLGGSFYCIQSVIFFNGSNTFCCNFAKLAGGAIHVQASYLLFNGVANFTNNSAASTGGAMFIAQSTVEFSGSTFFVKNGPALNGGAVICFGSDVLMTGTVVFDSNEGYITSALYVNRFNVTLSGNIVFKNNSGTSKAGTTLDVFNGSTILHGNILFSQNNGHFSTIRISLATVIVDGNSSYVDNAGHIGTAMYLVKSDVVFIGKHQFVNNTAIANGGVFQVDSSTIAFTGDFTFINNSAGMLGGVISARNGHIILNGTASFVNNRALTGGVVYLEYRSLLSLISPSDLVFRENNANRGAAIFVSDTSSSFLCESYIIFGVDLSMCFFRIEPSMSEESVALTFENNTVSIPNGGESIFGGMLDRCIPSYESFTGLSLLKKIIPDFNISTISSEPLRLCFCVNGTPDCHYQPPTFGIVRGQTVTLSIVAFNQVSRMVSASIQGIFPSSSAVVSDFGEGQVVQQVDASCTDLDYTILTSEVQIFFAVYAEGPCDDNGNASKQISVVLKNCPLAFELSDSRCVCVKRLQEYTNTCSVESESFQRSGDFWVGSDYANGSYTGLVIHPHCPFDYCRSGSADISVNDLDSQCAFSREGVLCGSCQGNLSLPLGSSRCMECSNSYLALLIPFAAAGIFLVLMLFLLRLTVSVGTLSGLIFYANIVSINTAIFFPPGATNILTVFIAWLNLDLGIETCFYSGMDIYMRTWFQFIFPVYTVLLAMVIILGSQYLKKFPKLLSRNPISVLATLFLLSYAKVLQTVITAISATSLEYPNNTTQTVWLYDGNVEYLGGKHVPLFVFSLSIVIFLLIPYTLLLVFGHWMQGLSNNKVTFWLRSV